MDRNAEQAYAKRLHETRRGMYETVDAYRRSFIDPITGTIAAQYLQERRCPVCDSEDDCRLFVKNGGTYVKCRSCGMIYLNPVFTDDALRSYYAGNSSVQADAHSNESQFYRSTYSSGLAAIEEFVATGNILDVGCSGGFFLDTARDRGWKTYGIEINQAEHKIASNKGHAVWNIPLEQIDSDTLFDAIAMWDVFEHVKEGGTYLRALAARLRKNGVIFLQIPNVASLAARILREHCNMFDGIEHVCLYSPDTIRRLCANAGFAALTMKTVIDELSVIRNYLNYDDPYFGEFAGDGDTLGFLTPEILHQSLLGYKMQIVLRPGF